MTRTTGLRCGLLSAGVAGLMLAACGGMGGSDGAVVDAQAVNPNGTVLQVLSVRGSGERALVNVRILNGRDREIRLNQGRENSYILTDGGERLLLVAPPGNANLAVPGGRAMDGALVFEGSLPRSGQATLVLNAGGQSDSVHSNAPRFEVALPLAGAAGGGAIPEASALSNMRPAPASALRRADGAGSTLGAGARGASDLRVVEALKSELGAVETDRGTLVSLPGDVTFDFDRATLRGEAIATLDRLAELIAASGGDGRIMIEGHTDARGEEAYNQRLSEQRAEAVKAHLVSKGVDAARIETRGLGMTRPVAPNARPDGSDDEEGRQRNRRVEVVLPAAAAPPAGSGGATSSLEPVGD